jgi:hypothetical protein
MTRAGLEPATYGLKVKMLARPHSPIQYWRAARLARSDPVTSHTSTDA